MRWLFLLVAVVASAEAAPVKEDPQALAQRLVDTEEECEHLKKLAAGKAEYAGLVDACEASFLLDRYAYIDQNNVVVDPEQDRFTVTTSKGEETVKKPPQLSADELQGVLTKYEEKQALVEKSSSKRAQEIVNQQVLCELQESTGEDECTKKLNCLKDEFMAEQNLNLKDNPQTIPITYKGKEAKIASPPDLDRKELCQSYSTATTPETAAENAVETSSDDGEDEFTALDNLAEESPNYRSGGKKMVTKSLDNPLMDIVMSSIANNVAGNGGGGGGNDIVGVLANKMMGMAGPQIGGMLTNSIVEKYAKGTPLAKMKPQDMTTLIKLATNKFKAKENQEKIKKSDVKGVVEIVTKTVVHFAILSLQAHNTVNADGQTKKKKKGLAKFVETLEVAMIDALAASAVNYVVDILMPDEEELPPTKPDKPAKDAKGGGFLSTLTNLASSITAPSSNAAPAAAAAAAPAPTNPAGGGLGGLAAQLLKAALNGA